MPTSDLDLLALGKRLHMVDDILVQMLAARHKLAGEVSRYKRKNGLPIYRPDIERKRIEEACAYGARLGLTPEYVSSIMYGVIREACMDQVIDRERNDGPIQPLTYEQQKANLLELTSSIAGTYDATYAMPYATRVLHDYEDQRLENLILEMPRGRRGRFLDLGCGTGKIAFRAAYMFKKVVGYDLSAPMLAVARQKHASRHANTDVSFVEADLDNGIPEPDESVSFVAMTLGTGSDIREIENLVEEIQRVLEPEGRFLVSFYNAGALLYEWQYVPWQLPLAAWMNIDEHTLEVPHAGKTYQVFARPRTIDEVKELFSWALAGSLDVTTYPTILPVIPNEAFVGQPSDQLARTLGDLEKQLAHGHHGAYAIVGGHKY